MNTGHPHRGTPSTPRARTSPPARRLRVGAVAVLAVAGGVWWMSSSPWTTRASAPESARAAQPTMDAGYAELAERDIQIRVWNTALDADTGSALVLGQLAALHMQRAREGGGWDDYLTAERLARHSIARRTNRNGASAVTLVNALLAQHRFTEARTVARDLATREYDIPEYRALLGEVAMELGDDVLADSMFRSVWEQRQTLSIAPRVARWLELTNHVPAARAVLIAARDEAVSRRNIASETKAWFHLRVGDLELRAGNLRRAEQAFRDGLEVEPGDPRLFSAMARLAMARDEPRTAITWAERAISLQLDPATLGVASDAYAALGDTANANAYVRTLDVAVSTQPDAYHRAWALHLLDHGVRMDTVLAKAQAELAERRDVYGYDLVAWALYRTGRVRDASVMMQRALRFDTPDPLLARHARAISTALSRQLASR